MQRNQGTKQVELSPMTWEGGRGYFQAMPVSNYTKNEMYTSQWG